MKKSNNHIIWLAITLSCLFWIPSQAYAEPVTLPIRIDYPILRALMLTDLFTDPGPSLILTDPGDKCRQIRLSDPRLALDNSRIRLEMAVYMQGGTSVGDKCLFPVQWEGFIRAYARPALNRANWQLTFDWADSELLNRNRQPAVVMGRLWKIFEGPVFDHLNELAIDLTPPIEELKPFLLSITPAASRSRMHEFMDSLKPGDISATSSAITINISGNMAVAEMLPEQLPAEPLSSEEIEEFIKTWEAWDTFLINALLSLSDDPLTPDERQCLFDILIETRYGFVEALARKTPGPDFVRQQFISAWKQMAPVLRAHLGQPTADDPWAYLAYFTASDALAAIDKLGPAVNIDISRDGLIRLARMISSNKSLLLNYTYELNPGLRGLFGMGPPIEESGPAFGKEELKLNKSGPDGFVLRHPLSSAITSAIADLFTQGRCWAASQEALPGIKEMRKWLVSRENLDSYLDKVKAVISQAVRKNSKQGTIPDEHQEMFEQLVHATAWQESCFRQFIIKNQKLTFIRSYNNTSVGIMQINERVWRGMYNQQHLRWNVNYNAEAGVEILKRYLNRYVLPETETLEALGLKELAACLYAMYNGGPSQRKKFPKRMKSGHLYISDKHFKEKYNWVKNDAWDRLSICLFGQ